MHEISIPQSVIDRVVARRGRAHVWDDLDPARSALVVIDMQNGFMLPGVAHSLCETAVETVPNINAIAAALRAAGGQVVWVQNRFTEESRQSWSNAHLMVGAERTERRADAMREGSKGHELWADLEVLPQDLIVQKERFSAFIEGSSDIEAILRARGIDTVIICGTVTNVCCESSARDAMMRNFKVIFVSDGNSAQTDEEHNATLISMYLTFADVMSTEYLIGRIRRPDRALAAQ